LQRQALEAHMAPGATTGMIDMPASLHVLTHRDLHLHPVLLDTAHPPLHSEESGGWFERAQWQQLGLPAPVRKLLDEMV
jgi:A/G-specific adenine glycosylase